MPARMWRSLKQIVSHELGLKMIWSRQPLYPRGIFDKSPRCVATTENEICCTNFELRIEWTILFHAFVRICKRRQFSRNIGNTRTDMAGRKYRAVPQCIAWNSVAIYIYIYVILYYITQAACMINSPVKLKLSSWFWQTRPIEYRTISVVMSLICLD